MGVKALSEHVVNVDNTMSWGSQLKVILEKLEAADPEQLPSLEDHVKVYVGLQVNGLLVASPFKSMWQMWCIRFAVLLLFSSDMVIG